MKTQPFIIQLDLLINRPTVFSGYSSDHETGIPVAAFRDRWNSELSFLRRKTGLLATRRCRQLARESCMFCGMKKWGILANGAADQYTREQ